MTIQATPATAARTLTLADVRLELGSKGAVVFVWDRTGSAILGILLRSRQAPHRWSAEGPAAGDVAGEVLGWAFPGPWEATEAVLAWHNARRG